LKFHFLAIYLVEYLSVLLGKEVYMAFLLKVHILLKRKLSGVRHSFSYRFFLSMIILLGLVLPASSSASAAELAEQSGVNNFTWTQTSADDPMLFSYMGDRSLRLDTNNHPHCFLATTFITPITMDQLVLRESRSFRWGGFICLFGTG
jgi:hypothetical protein